MSVAGAAVLWIESGLEVGEPQRSFRCLPPASTLAWALPPIELGYALHDLLDGLRMRRADLVAHGLGIGLGPGLGLRFAQS